MKTYTVTALADVAYYLVMGMESELEDAEKAAIDATLHGRGLPGGGAWATLEDDGEFGTCEVTGQRGSVVTVLALHPGR